MHSNRLHRAFTIRDLAASLAAVAVLAAVSLPALARARASSGNAGSMANLTVIGVAHVLYAADWNGRQVTWTVDDLGAYDSVTDYNLEHGCSFSFPMDPGCHPAILAGWGATGLLYGYWMNGVGYHWAVSPINFEGGATGFGSHRLVNQRPVHEYLNGRYYDPVYYAPNDAVPLESALPLFGAPEEFNLEGNPPIWSSYSMSPAAMYHPDVLRANADGGWQDPWSLSNGFQSPGLFEATYPSLKTLMIEQHWVQDPPALCNDGSPGHFGDTYVCVPYQFNHGVDSAPVTLFYDLAVRLLPNAEVLAADQAVLKQTGEVDGLWHRGTPFGENGFFIDEGFDGVPLSHHILTTDGILGRDTLGDQGVAAAWDGAGFKPAAAAREASFLINTGPHPALMLEPQP